MFLNFQPLYLQSLGASAVTIGSILGGVGAAMALAHLPAGYLADRFGRRPLLWGAWILATFATWVMAVSSSLLPFAVGVILYGFTAFVAGPLNGYITEARGHWSVGRALTLVIAFYHAGSILGPLVGGWIGERLGLRYSFVLAGILFLISTGVILKIKDQPIQPASARSVSSPAALFKRRQFLTFLTVMFFSLLCMYLPQPLSQNFLQNERSLSLGDIGGLLSMRSAGVVLFNLLLGRFNPRIGFILTQISMGLFSLAIWRGNALPWYLLGYLLLGSFQTARSLIVAQGRALIESEHLGLGYGAFETVSSVVFLIGSPIAGYLTSIEPAFVYPVSAFAISLSILFSLSMIRLRLSETTA